MSASLTIPKQTVSLTSTNKKCKADCAIERINWYSIVSAVNSRFTDMLIAQSASCPRRGTRRPQMGYSAARRLLRVHLKNAPTFTYQTYVTSYIPSVCRSACDKGQTIVTLPAFSWEWGKTGFANSVGLFCRKGYDKATNRCNDIRGFAVVENSEAFFNSVCNARVPSMGRIGIAPKSS